MLLVRDVFQAKYGRGHELVALIKEIEGYWEGNEKRDLMQEFRVLTDASGTFFTVVTETVTESFATWDQLMAAEFALPQFAEWFGRMTAVTDSGRREFYNIVA